MDAFAALRKFCRASRRLSISVISTDLSRSPPALSITFATAVPAILAAAGAGAGSGAGMGAEVDAEVEPMSLIPSFQALRRISGISSSMVALDLMLRRIGLLSTVGLRRLREAVRLCIRSARARRPS